MDVAQPPHHDQRTGQAAAVGRGPDLRLVLLGGLAAVVVGAVILQLGVLIVHPVASGSTFSVSGGRGTQDCDTRMVEPPQATPCVELNFQPAGRFGIVFTVRNNGPLPMTLTRFTPQGAVEPALYELDSAIVGSAAGGASPAFADFEPLTIPPFGEAPVALVGSFGTCEAIGDSWSPGDYGGVTTVAVNVRWGLMSIDHYVVLPGEVHFRAPDAGQCE